VGRIDFDALAVKTDIDWGVPAARLGKAAAFLKGPIPMQWLEAVCTLKPGTCCLWIAIRLWYFAGLRKSRRFQAAIDQLRGDHYSTDATRRALRRLEAAGLILVRRRRGQRLEFEILANSAKTIVQ
jgi:hypothetical protein